MTYTKFQFTPARGGRHNLSVANRLKKWFQFTPARGGRPAANGSSTPWRGFQFTPARGGRRQTWPGDA